MFRGGRFIVDVAHGGEQAHDPEQRFGKSAEGQLACLSSVNDIAEATTWIPHGVMIEASDIKSPTDPVVPLDEAFDALRRLSSAHSKHLERAENATRMARYALDGKFLLP
jgi:hypothetical protein